jgi:hypothetical protein
MPLREKQAVSAVVLCLSLGIGHLKEPKALPRTSARRGGASARPAALSRQTQARSLNERPALSLASSVVHPSHDRSRLQTRMSRALDRYSREASELSGDLLGSYAAATWDALAS